MNYKEGAQGFKLLEDFFQGILINLNISEVNMRKYNQDLLTEQLKKVE